MEHSRRHLADGPVDVLGADIDLPVRLTSSLPDFIYTAPAISSTPAIRRYGDGRAGKLVIIEVMVEKVDMASVLATISDTLSIAAGLPCFDVLTAYPFEHIFQVGKGDKDSTVVLPSLP